jgi:hypothetical protein
VAAVALPVAVSVAAALGLGYAIKKTSDVESHITAQAKTLHNAHPQDFSAFLQDAHAYYSRMRNEPPSAFAMNEPSLQQVYATNPAAAWASIGGRPSSGAGSITVNVHPGAVTVNSSAKTSKDLGNDIAYALADHIQQWAHAQKSLRGSATAKVPGVVGGSR